MPGPYTGRVMAIRPELRAELLNLSSEERQELADDLYDSVASDALDPEWEAAWSSEIERRVQDILANRVALLDADDVHAELRAELRTAPR